MSDWAAACLETSDRSTKWTRDLISCLLYLFLICGDIFPRHLDIPVCSVSAQGQRRQEDLPGSNGRYVMALVFEAP